VKEKGPGFIPGSRDLPDEVRTTAWDFMGQQVPQNYGRLVFGTPLCKEDDFDPLLDSIYGAAAESSHEREASAQSDELMKNPYEQPSKRRRRSQDRERNLKIHGSNNAPHQEVQNLHNMIHFQMILSKMLKTINKRNHQSMSKMIPWVKKL